MILSNSTLANDLDCEVIKKTTEKQRYQCDTANLECTTKTLVCTTSTLVCNVQNLATGETETRESETDIDCTETSHQSQTDQILDFLNGNGSVVLFGTSGGGTQPGNPPGQDGAD